MKQLVFTLCIVFGASFLARWRAKRTKDLPDHWTVEGISLGDSRESVLAKKGNPLEGDYPPNSSSYKLKKGLLVIDYRDNGNVCRLTGDELKGPDGHFQPGDSVNDIVDALGEPDEMGERYLRYYRPGLRLTVVKQDETIQMFTIEPYRGPKF